MTYAYTVRTRFGTFDHLCTADLAYAVVYCGRNPTGFLRWAEGVRSFHLARAVQFEQAAAEKRAAGRSADAEDDVARAAESRDAARTSAAAWLTKHRVNADAIFRHSGTCEAWTKTREEADAVAARLEREGCLDVTVERVKRRRVDKPLESHGAPHRFDARGHVVFAWGAADVADPQPPDVALPAAKEILGAAGLDYAVDDEVDRARLRRVRVLAPWRFLVREASGPKRRAPAQSEGAPDDATVNYRCDIPRVLGSETLRFLDQAGIDARLPSHLSGTRTGGKWTYDVEFTLPATLVLARREEAWPFALATSMWPEIDVGIRAAGEGSLALVIHAEGVPSRIDSMERARAAVRNATVAAGRARASLERLQRTGANDAWTAFVEAGREHDRELWEARRLARADGFVLKKATRDAFGWEIAPAAPDKKRATRARSSLPDPQYESGAALAHELRSFLGSFLGRSEVVTRVLKVGKPAAPEVLRRAMRDPYLPRELVGLCSRMDGLALEWSLKRDRRFSGALRIPSLARNMRGWAVPGLEVENRAAASTVRVLDEVPYSRPSRHAPVTLEGEFGWWDHDVFQPAGSVEQYLRAGMWNLFVDGWWAVGFDARKAVLTPTSFDARVALGMQVSRGEL